LIIPDRLLEAKQTLLGPDLRNSLRNNIWVQHKEATRRRFLMILELWQENEKRLSD